MTDTPTPERLAERLREAANGHPDAKIPWPHRILHEAAAEIERLREDVKNIEQWRQHEQQQHIEQRARAEAAEQELAERYEDDVPKHVAWDVLVKRTAELTRYKAVVEAVRECIGMGEVESSNRLDTLEQALAALEDGE